MALSFTGTQHLDQAPLISAYPFSLECWFSSSAGFTANVALMSLSSTSGTENFYTLLVTSSAKLRGIAQTGASTNNVATNSTSLTVGPLYHGVAVFTNATTVTIYFNGVATAGTATSIAFSGTNLLSIGALYLNTTTAIDLWKGMIAYPTVRNIALSQTDVTALYNAGSGANPNSVQSGSVVSFSAFQSGPPYLDTGASTTWTLTGSPTIVADPFSLTDVSPIGAGSLIVTGTSAPTLALPNLVGLAAVTGTSGVQVVAQPQLTGGIQLTGAGAISLGPKTSGLIGVSGSLSITLTGTIALALTGSVGITGIINPALVLPNQIGAISVTGSSGVQVVAQPQLAGAVGVTGVIKPTLSEAGPGGIGVSGVLSIQFAGTIALSGMTGAVGIAGLVNPAIGFGLLGQMSLLGTTKPSLRFSGQGNVRLSGAMSVTLIGVPSANGPCPGMRIKASVQRYSKSTVRVKDPKTGTVTLVK